MVRYTVRKRKRLYHGRIVQLHEDDVAYKGIRFTRENLVHPGAVAVIPILDDGRIVMVRQFRYAAKRELLEIPAGTLERGERPVDCAKRELEEEAGYTATTVRRLGACFPVPGYSTEHIILFTARGLTPCPPRPEPDELLTIQRLSITRVRSLIANRRILDAKTLVALLYYFWDQL